MAREYVFVDEWDVAAPIEEVFDTLADARTYPAWWRPVYLNVEGDDPPRVGTVTYHHFKGRLPYTLEMRAEMVRMERPRQFEIKVDGGLRARGVWTLTPTAKGVHVRFDWIVFADRPLLRYLTPVLRPLFRANHDWAIERAKEGH